MSKYNAQLTALLLLASIMTFAQIPGTLSYQGILVDNLGAPVTDGNHTVDFGFYTVASGGTEVFSRGPFTVVTYRGMFTFVIGTGTPGGNTDLPTLATEPNYIGASQYFVEVVADGVTLAPRVQLSTVPYSLHAQNANTMDAAGLTGTVDGSLVGSGISGTNITSGTVADARLEPTMDLTRLNTTGGVHVGGTSDPGIDNLLVDGTATATSFSGAGGPLTGLNATNLSTGTVSNLLLDADLQDLADGSLTGSLLGAGINGTNITSGTVADARLEPTVDLTRLNTTGGVHVGGTSDPGVDNLLVDGTVTLQGTAPVLGIDATSGNPQIFYRENAVDQFQLGYHVASNYFFLAETGVGEHLVIQDGGNVGVGTNNPLTRLDVEGSTSSAVVTINKNFAIGSSIVSFERSGSAVGSISESAGLVSYNTFTGSHFGILQAEIEMGILVSLDGSIQRIGNTGEPIYGLDISNKANSPFVLGSYLHDVEDHEMPGVKAIMAVGNGEMWVVDNGQDIKVGDYLISSDVLGHATLDNGDFELAYVIARVGEDVKWANEGLFIDGKKHKRVTVFFENFIRNNKAERLEAELSGMAIKLEEVNSRLGKIETLMNLESKKSN